MKKLLILVFIIVLSRTANAQDDRQAKTSISAGYGLLTVPEIIEGTSDILGTAFSGGTVTYDDGKFSGAIFLNLKIPIGKRFTLGTDVVYEKFSKKVHSEQTGESLGDSKGQYISVIPRLDFYWVNRKALRLYSGVGAGVAFANQKFDDDKANDVLFAFNAAPIGIELGNTISFFGEASIGYNGLINVGIRIRP